jgi:hypothetical protein
MNKKLFYQRGYGGLGMFICAVIIGFIMYFYFYPTKFPKTPTGSSISTFCRPHVEANGNFKPDAPEIMAPAYEWPEGAQKPTIANTLVPYRLIKTSVPIADETLKNYFSKDELRDGSSISDHKCGDITYGGAVHNHFCQWTHKALKISGSLSDAYQYGVTFPANYASNFAKADGVSNAFTNSVDVEDINFGQGELLLETYHPDEGVWRDKSGKVSRMRFAPFHILFLVHLDKDGNFITADTDGKWPLVDVYQQVSPGNRDVPIKPLPKELIQCYDIPQYIDSTASQQSKPGKVMESSPDKKQEQLGWFLFEMPIMTGWWQPSCKPAIYLYPESEQRVNVQVSIPNGFVTYTDPVYPKGGWDVLAKPSGQLQYLRNNFSDSTGKINYPTGIFPYLYYEGKVADSAVRKPEEGYVTSYDQLASFFDELLFKLGLNEKEAGEFREYWLKALPPSPYYFVGILPQEQLNQRRTLTDHMM